MKRGLLTLLVVAGVVILGYLFFIARNTWNYSPPDEQDLTLPPAVYPDNEDQAEVNRRIYCDGQFPDGRPHCTKGGEPITE